MAKEGGEKTHAPHKGRREAGGMNSCEEHKGRRNYKARHAGDRQGDTLGGGTKARGKRPEEGENKKKRTPEKRE